jgi:hypothetical protein
VADVLLPAGGDENLARLLAGCGLPAIEKCNELAQRSAPAWRGDRTVALHGRSAAHVGPELLTLARRARASGDLGADVVAGLAAQLGYREPEPAAEAEPAAGY